MRNKEKAKNHREFLYRTKYLPTYLLFMSLYPFTLEDLPGETWEDIEGYDGDYQESNFGRTKSLKGKTPIILKPGLSRSGYLQVNLYKEGNSKKIWFISLLLKFLSLIRKINRK